MIIFTWMSVLGVIYWILFTVLISCVSVNSQSRKKPDYEVIERLEIELGIVEVANVVTRPWWEGLDL